MFIKHLGHFPPWNHAIVPKIRFFWKFRTSLYRPIFSIDILYEEWTKKNLSVVSEISLPRKKLSVFFFSEILVFSETRWGIDFFQVYRV